VNRNTAIVIEMHKYGTSLPSINPHRDTGLTSNCSNVPRFRSRTIDIATANTVAICSAVPITPGTKKFGARIAGLYNTCGRTSTGRSRARFRRAAR
jgi:hypothetical protein